MRKITDNDLNLIHEYRQDWNKYAWDVLNVRLDKKQQEVLFTIQVNKRTTIRSGHKRGKDYTAATATLCYFYLNPPCKVILTAPSGRQVESIMMAEIAKIHANAKIPLGGRVLNDMIKFDKKEYADWYLLGFKADHYHPEAWTGYNSPNNMIVMTEASGIDDAIFDAIEGMDAKMVIVFNPRYTIGRAYETSKSKYWESVKLSSLDSPNVVAKEEIIPGQVTYDWVKERIERWCEEIDKKEMNIDYNDFEFEGRCYRPNDDFRIKALGEFPRESEDILIPMTWIEAAVERWKTYKGKFPESPKRIGTDVAGEGRDKTVHVIRVQDVIPEIKSYLKQDHMVTAGQIKVMLDNPKHESFIDTIGEGAGVYSRLKEQNVPGIHSAKFSHSAKYHRDLTGERTFYQMRDYCFWAIRDWLNPHYDSQAAIPPIPELIEELNSIKYAYQSNGDIKIEAKDDIKERIGRSPDYADALALTFYPSKRRKDIKPQTKSSLGIY
jgi:hypothetical protein